MRVNISVRDVDASIWKQAGELARKRDTSVSRLIVECLRREITSNAARTHDAEAWDKP